MKASELRIGNWYCFADNDGVVYRRVKEIKQNEFGLFGDYDGVNFEICQPIPLTEEWLLKFGFKEFEIDECWYLVKDNFMFEKSGIVGFYEYMDINAVAINEGRTKYVHQLQNLYFALTGEELTLKQ